MGERWPIFGLQPRGIDPREPPHTSVEEAAVYYLESLVDLRPGGPIHLVGHSFGGLVALEMALRLNSGGRAIASLTLIDTEPPDATEHLDRTQQSLEIGEIYGEFVEVFEGIFERTLSIDETNLASGNGEAFLIDLHAALVRSRCFSARTTPEILRGSLATFVAARLTTYVPMSVYPQTVHLVLAGSDRPSRYRSLLEAAAMKETYVVDWRHHAPKLEVWRGPGHHFSILQLPQVASLAAWWQRTRAIESESPRLFQPPDHHR